MKLKLLRYNDLKQTFCVKKLTALVDRVLVKIACCVAMFFEV